MNPYSSGFGYTAAPSRNSGKKVRLTPVAETVADMVKNSSESSRSYSDTRSRAGSSSARSNSTNLKPEYVSAIVEDHYEDLKSNQSGMFTQYAREHGWEIAAKQLTPSYLGNDKNIEKG